MHYIFMHWRLCLTVSFPFFFFYLFLGIVACQPMKYQNVLSEVKVAINRITISSKKHKKKTKIKQKTIKLANFTKSPFCYVNSKKKHFHVFFFTCKIVILTSIRTNKAIPPIAFFVSAWPMKEIIDIHIKSPCVFIDITVFVYLICDRG